MGPRLGGDERRKKGWWRRLGAVVLLAPGLAAAQEPESRASEATIEARASLIRAISIDSEGPLSFGQISPSATDTVTVTVSPQGVVTASTGTAVSPSPVAARPGPFRVAGHPDLAYQVSLPNTATLASGPATMRLSDFSVGFDGGGAEGRLDAAGEQSFAVGATLTVGPDQPSGEYVGTFPVTVRYQ